MKRAIVQSICCVMMAGTLFSSIPAAPCNPRTPRRIILNWNDAPATTMAITWRTLDRADDSRAQIHPAGPSPVSPAGARNVPAVSTPVDVGANGSAWSHSVNVSDLTPDTLYTYRVGAGKDWSEWCQFRTAGAQPAPLSFVYLGDTQNELFSQCSRLVRAALRKAPDALFFLHVGDLVSRSRHDDSWGDWFRSGDWIYRTIPQLMVPGNHEYYPAVPIMGKGLTPLWRPHFTLPENGPAGLEETAYVLDIQGVRLVGLNPNEKLEEQAVWLRQVLKSNPNRWTILFMHQPLYSTGLDRDNVKLRNLLLPVIDSGRVDLVLAGHDHTYGRTHRLYAGRRVSEDHSGTVYVTSVAGPKQYRLNPRFKSLMARMGADKQFFQTIDIRKNILQYTCWTADGILFDQFQLLR